MRASHMRDGIFWVLAMVVSLLLVICALPLAELAIEGLREPPRRLLKFVLASMMPLISEMIPFLCVFLLLGGLALVVLALAVRGDRIRKIFFVLTGASAAGIAILPAIWFALVFDNPDLDLKFLLVAPLLFVIGTVGSIVLFVKRRIAKRANVP